MALKLEDKKAIVAEVAAVASTALSAVAAEYRGLTVSAMNELRSKARESNIYLRVIRNTLARRAFEGTKLACLDEALVGPLVLALSHEEPGAAARLIKDFVKKNDKMVVRALAVDGQLLGAQHLDAVAKLPTRLDALAMLASVIQAPVTQFVRTLAEPHAKLVRTFAAVRDQKEKAA